MSLEFHYYVPGCFQDPRADIELGKYATERGFEGIWIGDHFLPWLDNRPFTHQVLPWLGAFMNEVPDITVGTFVTSSDDPVRTAHAGPSPSDAGQYVSRSV